MTACTPVSAAWRRTALRALVVVLLATCWRLFVDATQPGALFFPDSWCYAPINHLRSCTGGHSLFVQWFWRALSPSYTLHHVLLIQGLCGVASTLCCWATLRRVVADRVAIPLAVVVLGLPLPLMLEHAPMTEALETLGVTAGFWCVLAMLTTTSRRWRDVALATSALCFGVAAAAHAIFLIPAVLVLPVILGAWFRRRTAGSRRGVTFVQGLGASVALLTLTLLPSLPMTVRYHQDYGIWTTDPLQGPLLAERWSPLLRCDQAAGQGPLVEGVVRHACQRRGFLDPPGYALNAVYLYPDTTLLGRYPRAIGSASATLTRVVENDALHQPVVVLDELVRSMVWQSVAVEPGALTQFRPPWHYVATLRTRAKWFPNFTTFFGTQRLSVGRAPWTLRRWAIDTDWLPQVGWWLTIGLFAVWGVVWSTPARRRWHPSLPWLHARPLVTSGVVMVLGLLLAVGVGSSPDPRYWSPLLPLTVVLACALWPRRGR